MRRIKALTISQPYASLIASGEKWVENRRWGTSYRGALAIHAGSGTQYLSRKELEAYPTGCVIAIASLVACINIHQLLRWDRARELAPGITINDVLNHKHAEGPWCWVLANVRKLAEPIVCSGKQGLWDIDIDL